MKNATSDSISLARVSPVGTRWLSLLTTGVLVVTAVSVRSVEADEAPPAVAKYIHIGGAVDDVVDGRIRNAALSLQTQAEKEQRPVYLFLEIHPGASKFGHVRDLSKFLQSSEVHRVHTVAWVHGRLDGVNAVLAVACRDVVLHEDASVGAIGRPQPLDEDERLAVIKLAEENGNPLLDDTIARAMIDKSLQVLKIRVEGEEAPRVVTEAEYNRIAQNDVAIKDSEVVKESGEFGRFTASECRRLGIIASQIVRTRDQLASIYRVPFRELQSDPTDGVEIRPRLIRLSGMIEPIMEGFVLRQIRDAVNSGVNVLIFEIDSYGGYLSSGHNLALAIAELDPEQIRTVAYVHTKAMSAATMIAMGCDEIYLRRTAQIGDAGPIEVRPGQAFEHVDAKILSAARETMKSIADLKRRPPALLEAMVDRNLLVYEVTDPATGDTWYMSQQEIDESDKPWQRGRLVAESREDNFLTVSGERAHELGLAMPPVQDFEEMKMRVGIPAGHELKPMQPNWVDTVVFYLNTRAAMFLLLVCGILCLYLEVHFFSGFMGILSAVCFSLFFWSRFLNGTAGMLEIVLFLLGIGCLAMEIFVIPGFGVFGISGGLLIVTSLVMASQTFHGWGTSSDLPALSRNLGTIGASIIAVIGLGAAINRFLPEIPMFRSMVLVPPGSHVIAEDEPQLRPDLRTTLADSSAGTATCVPGSRGKAASMLRPAGKARILGHYVDVISNGPYISDGAEIEVIEVSGNRIVVRAVDQSV